MIQSRSVGGCQAGGRARLAVAAALALCAVPSAVLAAPLANRAALLDEARRYAPILWPAPGEPYLPAIPGEVAGDGAGGAHVGYRRAATADGMTIHQYWTYYVGEAGHRAHEHDAEVFSVFVDATGEVVGAAGSAHGPATLNNIVRARVPGAALPRHLHVLVEYGKHALAPDVDGDGSFEPGVDANVLGEEAWGVGDGHLRVPEDRFFERSTSADPPSARTYELYLVDELDPTGEPSNPRRDLRLHASYAHPQDVLEPWATDFVAVTAAAAQTLATSDAVSAAPSARIGLWWGRDRTPAGARAIEPFVHVDFDRMEIGDFGLTVHETRSGGPGWRYGAWGNAGSAAPGFGPAFGATLARWDRGGASGLDHGNVTIAIDFHADVTRLEDSKAIVSLGFGFPMVSREPAERLFRR